MRDLLPPLLHLGTGLGFLVFVFVAYRLGAQRWVLWVRLQLVGLLIRPVRPAGHGAGRLAEHAGAYRDRLAIGAGLAVLATIFVAGDMLVGRSERG